MSGKEGVMGNRISVMGLELDMLSEEAFQTELKEFLSNDSFNVVHMISLDYMDSYEENEQVRETLEEADLILPGEKAILSSCHVDVLETAGMVVDYRSALNLCGSDMLAERKCYLVLRNKKEAKVAYRYIVTHHPYMEIVGLYTAESSVTEEALVNDINTKLPDLIIMSMEGVMGEEWLQENRVKINAKLCVVLSSVMDIMIRENIHIPVWIKRFHLGKAYTRLARIPYTNVWRRRIFQKKMDNYNTRKLMEMAEVREELSDEDEGNEP